MKIISTVKSNKIFKVSLVFSFLLLVLMIVLLTFGHFVVGNIAHKKSAIIDFSNPIAQKRYNSLMSDFNNLKKERESLKLIRIPKDNVVSLVQYFDEIALKSSVKQTVNVVTGDGGKNKKEYNIPTVRYEVNIAGSFPAISEYLTNLKNAPFFLRIESFEVLAPSENSLTEDYLATIFVAVAVKE
ncbi:MAG: hypothetical protein WC269_06100 [Candidatus Gracilibacteria bacterium]|jgi:hypothetical protein